MRTHNRLNVLALILLAAPAACANRGGDWPSLMTAEEQLAGKASETPAMANPVSVAAAQPAPEMPTAAATTPETPLTVQTSEPDSQVAALVRAQTARLKEAQRDADFIQDRWQKQRADVAQSVSGIKSRGPADTQWNKAQMDLTRLNQIAAEWDDLESVLNQIAGELAIAGHHGAAVTPTLGDTGALLERARLAREAAASAASTFRKQLSR